MNDRDPRITIDPRGRRVALVGLVAIVAAAIGIALLVRLLGSGH